MRGDPRLLQSLTTSFKTSCSHVHSAFQKGGGLMKLSKVKLPDRSSRGVLRGAIKRSLRPE